MITNGNLLNNLKTKIMYSLDLFNYNRSFSTIEELVRDVIRRGIDPYRLVLRDGVSVGRQLIDFVYC